MKRSDNVLMRSLSFILSVSASLLMAACSNSTTTTNGPGTPQGTTLLQNSTFDSAGSGTLNGWIFAPTAQDSTPYFESDGPPPTTGQQWSIGLKTGSFSTLNMVTREFTGLSSGVYSLSAWARVSFGIGGDMSFYRSNADAAFADPPFTDIAGSDWKQYTVLDTLTLSPHDTIRIQLSGGYSDKAIGMTLFDNITFKKLP